MRKNNFISAAFAAAAGLSHPSLEEHAPDAGGETPNDVANTAAVQGVVEPVIAADGAGELTVTGDKPTATDEPTVEVPEVDSVAALQEHAGALEDEVYQNDQEFVQGVSQEFGEELEEAVDVVASLESLAESIDFAIASGHCNRSTNAAFYQAMTEAGKRGGFYDTAALEDNNAPQLTYEQAGGEDGAKSIGTRVKDMASAGYKAIIAGIQKFIGMVQDFYSKLTLGGENLLKKFQEFEKSSLAGLSGGEITNGALISRLGLVQGGGDAARQFETFISYCHGNLVRTIAGPVLQITNSISNKATDPFSTTFSTQALDNIIRLMYPETADQEDLRETETGTDWASGSTPDLMGGLRAWIVSNHNLIDEGAPLVIKSGISRDLETERPETIAAADSSNARANIRAIISILNHWKTLNVAAKLGRITTFIASANASRGDSGNDVDGGKARTNLSNIAVVLRAISGNNTISLVRHMLHVFGLYHTYLQASSKKAAPSGGGEVATV